MRKKRPAFGMIYGVVLTAAASFVLLDTFVIPKAQTAAAAELSSEELFASATAALSVSDTEDNGTETDGVNYIPHGSAALQEGQSTEAAAEAAAEISAATSAASAGAAGDTTAEDNTAGDDEVQSAAASAAETEAAAQSQEDASDSTAEPVVTSSSYSDENISVTITEETIAGTQVYIADVQLSSAAYLQTAFAEDTFGRNIKETTSDMAERNDAILAINGDYYGFRDYGYVIRNGVLYRDTSGDSEDLVIYADGTFAIADESETTAQELLSTGAWQVLSFGPALVEDGEISVSIGEEVDQAMNSNPRTAIGMISPLHYVIVVSDGRTEESEGLTLYELAEVLQDEGCTVGYNLDGGGSTTLYFMGEIINNPAGGRSGSSERKVSDIVYIGA